MELCVSLQRETPVWRRTRAPRPGFGCVVGVCLAVAFSSPCRAQLPAPVVLPASASAPEPGTEPGQAAAQARDLRFGPEFWASVRAAAHAVREPLNDEYARRYRISPELARDIIEVATAEGIDPDLAFRLIQVESRFVRHARGPQPTLGLMQLMPGTARQLDPSLRTEAAVLDPANNMRTGFRYLRSLIQRYDGNVRLGLLAYNRGENACYRALRRGQDPENGYSRKGLNARPGARYQGKGLIGRKHSPPRPHSAGAVVIRAPAHAPTSRPTPPPSVPSPVAVRVGARSRPAA